MRRGRVRSDVCCAAVRCCCQFDVYRTSQSGAYLFRPNPDSSQVSTLLTEWIAKTETLVAFTARLVALTLRLLSVTWLCGCCVSRCSLPICLRRV